MCSQFLTPAQQDALSINFFTLHNTFARPIVVWKSAQNIVLATNPSNNYFFENTPFNDTTNKVLISGVFMARVSYPDNKNLNFFTEGPGQGQDQINLLKDIGYVRIRVDITGQQYLYDSDRVTFDNDIFFITSTQRPHGLFAPKFYDYILTRVA